MAELTKRHDDDVAALQHQLDETKKKLADVQAQLDDATSLVGQLKDRLEKAGQNVDSLVAEKGKLTHEVADTAARLEEARKQAALAEARAAAFRNLVAKLHSMIDSGQLKVVIRNGRMIIQLPSDILFESGKTEVKKDGKVALAKVAQVLATVPDRNFLVAGHTDNVPIKNELYPSNWELSTRRAVEVVHILIAAGMSPKTLAAGGYGEFDPIETNDTNEHKAQNRRIEIVLQPNLSDLPPLDIPNAPTK